MMGSIEPLQGAAFFRSGVSTPQTFIFSPLRKLIGSFFGKDHFWLKCLGGFKVH